MSRDVRGEIKPAIRALRAGWIVDPEVKARLLARLVKDAERDDLRDGVRASITRTILDGEKLALDQAKLDLARESAKDLTDAIAAGDYRPGIAIDSPEIRDAMAATLRKRRAQGPLVIDVAPVEDQPAKLEPGGG